MATYWKLVNDVIRKSDLLLVIADARFSEQSVNEEVLDKIERSGKKYIIVFNKCDLTKQAPFVKNSVCVSATKHTGNMALLRKINTMLKGEKGVVGVLGYPNTGKSSVINSIKGKKSAPVSSVSGYTKGLQTIRVTSRVWLIDTPGVIPYKSKDEFLQVLIGAKDAMKLKDPEFVALQLIEYLNGRIEKFYGVKRYRDVEETLDEICIKKNVLKRGGIPDTVRMAKRLIHEWQTGMIR